MGLTHWVSLQQVSTGVGPSARQLVSKDEGWVVWAKILGIWLFILDVGKTNLESIFKPRKICILVVGHFII